MTRVLCVAEKPSIAKAVAGHLAGGNPQTVSLDTTGPFNACTDPEAARD
jgi:DNA topoisomerase-3